MILMLVPPLRRFHATPLDDAVTVFDFRAHIGQLVSRFVTSVPRVGSDGRTCSMPTLSPRSYCSRIPSLYATLSLTANSLLVLPRPLVGTVLPVAVLIAYVLSTMKVVRPCAPISPGIARVTHRKLYAVHIWLCVSLLLPGTSGSGTAT